MSDLRSELGFWDAITIGAQLANCRYPTEDWKLKASEGIKRVKEQLGMSSSPETGNGR